MEGFSGGDIQNTVKRAVVRGMRDVLAGIADQISQPHFELGIGIVKASKEAFANKFTRSVPLHVIKPGPSRIKRRQVAVERPHR